MMASKASKRFVASVMLMVLLVTIIGGQAGAGTEALCRSCPAKGKALRLTGAEHRAYLSITASDQSLKHLLYELRRHGYEVHLSHFWSFVAEESHYVFMGLPFDGGHVFFDPQSGRNVAYVNSANELWRYDSSEGLVRQPVPELPPEAVVLTRGEGEPGYTNCVWAGFAVCAAMCLGWWPCVSACEAFFILTCQCAYLGINCNETLPPIPDPPLP